MPLHNRGCVLSPLLFNIFMADLPSQLKTENSVSCNEHDTLNSIIWADDILILSDTVEGLNLKLATLNSYCHDNGLKIKRQNV